jgi:5-keto-L-gluconate epimerase
MDSSSLRYEMYNTTKPRLSIVLSTHSAGFEAVAYKGNFEANVSKIASWGYEGIELAVRDPNLVDEDMLRNVTSSQRLRVSAIGTGQAWGEEGLSFTNPDIKVRTAAIMRIKQQIHLAQRLNTLVIIGLIRGVTPAGQTKSQSIQYLKEGLRECAEEAEGRGVRLALEPLNRYETDLIHTAAEALELIHQIGSPSLGLLLDTFHMNIEETNIEICIRRCSEHIVHFHVADSNRWYPGAGHLDFHSIIQTLNSTGYQGWISGEFLPAPDADTAAQRSIQHLRKIMDEIT